MSTQPEDDGFLQRLGGIVVLWSYVESWLGEFLGISSRSQSGIDAHNHCQCIVEHNHLSDTDIAASANIYEKGSQRRAGGMILPASALPTL